MISSSRTACLLIFLCTLQVVHTVSILDSFRCPSKRSELKSMVTNRIKNTYWTMDEIKRIAELCEEVNFCNQNVPDWSDILFGIGKRERPELPCSIYSYLSGPFRACFYKKLTFAVYTKAMLSRKCNFSDEEMLEIQNLVGEKCGEAAALDMKKHEDRARTLFC